MQEKRISPVSMRGCALVGIIAFAALCIGPARAQRLLGEGPGWETLEGCRLRQAWANDGDSFHVEHGDRKYIFRLYFVDAPETGTHYKDRVKQQAKHFGISQEAVVKLGRRATDFTRQQLQEPFTVITRWQNAYGNEDLPRFYAGVRVGGQDLAELLTERGMVRRRGAQASYPGTEATVLRHRLKDLEKQAKAEGRGGWSDEWERYTPGAKVPTMGAYVPEETKISLNSAGAEELMRLPRIRTEMAQMIISNRPYKAVEELDDLPGIGPKTIERLKPLVILD